MDTLSPGTKLGRYEIRSKIGEGGMGEVYLAQDTKLDRKVALKILPADVADNPDRMKRFVQEAKAASALNHPNIITIYEIDETESGHFIATEFIDGETLRERTRKAPLRLAESLEIATQIASALAAAHAAGIIHRDLKPENVMVRRDGIVKLLDFGLAKLTQASAPAVDTQAATKLLVQTEPGRVMGTVAYMSPEQVRGLDLDALTDIWSLGVVVYEMLAGHAPFTGETSSHIGYSILEKEPAPITRYAPEAPTEFQRILRKALAKNPDDRYQTVRDLLIDLKNLRRELEIQSEIERSAAPAVETLSASAATGAPAKSTDSLNQTTAIAERQPTTSAEYLISEIKRHKRGAIIFMTALLVVVVSALLGLYKLVVQKSSDQTARSSTTGQNMKIQRLPGDGKVESAAISPDGKYVSYVVRDGEQQSLLIRLVATNDRKVIVPPADVKYGEQTFSPDGIYIYYVATDKNNPNGALYQVSVLGGARKRILVNIESPITFSPDGQRFAFVRNEQATFLEDQLIVVNTDGTGERKLAVRKGDDWFWYGGPAWSPDGKVIACGAGSYRGGWHWLVTAVEVETGNQKEFTTQRWFRVGRVAWLTDGSGLLVSAADQGSTFYQVWQISYPRGEARRITNDLNDYGGISLTADSKAFVAVQAEWTSNIWIAPNGDMNQAKQITFGKQLEGSVPDLFGPTLGLAWTPDGRIVYTSMASGNIDLWIMNQDGTEQKQLTSDPTIDFMPAVSPDGRYLVFISHRSVFPSLWRTDLDGGNLKQLDDKEDYVPQISADSRWIVFNSLRDGVLGGLWKMPIDGGAPVKSSDKIANGPTISPDGTLIACLSKDEQPDSLWKIMVIPFEGGTAIKTFDVTQTVSGVRWTPDGRAITYIDTRGVMNLWSQPYDGGPPKQLTNFKDQGVWERAWSLDGKWLALARGTVTKDVVLIRDFR